jgi:hypothetical protein
MSNGVFGTVRPAKLNRNDIGNDVEILYYYTPTRGGTSDSFNGYKRLNASECLVPAVEHEDDSLIINGLYKLRLPIDKFNKKGIYYVYIRPKEYKTTIIDVSVLAAYPDVKGVVLDTGSNDLSGVGSDLVGYRMELSDGTTRLIKSCNRCEPVIVNTGDGYPKATRYNLTDNSSSYVFCTVSPSAAPTFKPNAKPNIGSPMEEVKIVNTLFTPQLYTIELVSHDIETLSYMLEGDQVTDRDNAIITTYNDNHEIYHQSDYYVLKDKLGQPLYNVKRKRKNIDINQSYDNIIE